MKHIILIPALLLCLLLISSTQAAEPTPANGAAHPKAGPLNKVAKFIASHLKAKRGFALDVGCGDTELAQALAHATSLRIHAVDTDATQIARLRTSLADKGLYGTRIVLDHVDHFKKLAFPDRWASLVVFGDGFINGLRERDLKEAYRILAPTGIAVIGDWRSTNENKDTTDKGVSKQQLETLLKDAGITRYTILEEQGLWAIIERQHEKGWDEWTHRNHNPQNTASSHDDIAPDKLKLQWVTECPPTLASATMYLAGGKQFLIGPEYEKQPETTPSIHCLDAYTGLELWKKVGKKELPYERSMLHYSSEKSCSDVIAFSDELYVLAGKECIVFAAETGDVIQKLTLPDELQALAIKSEADFEGPAIEHAKAVSVKLNLALILAKANLDVAASAVKKFEEKPVETDEPDSKIDATKTPIEPEGELPKGNTEKTQEEASTKTEAVQANTKTLEEAEADLKKCKKALSDVTRNIKWSKGNIKACIQRAKTDDPKRFLYIATEDNILYFSMGRTPKSHIGNWSMPWRGVGWILYAVDRANGKVLWSNNVPHQAGSICLGGGRIYFYDMKKHYHALDAKTGTEQWVQDKPGVEKASYVILSTYFQGKLWMTYNLNSDHWMNQGRLVKAFSAETGKPLFELPLRKDNKTATIFSFSGKTVYSHHQHSGKPMMAFNGDSGEMLWARGDPFSGCTPMISSQRAIFGRFNAGPGGMDLETKKVHLFRNIRPTCFLPPTPANGMLYVAGPGCNCGHGMRANIGLAPGTVPPIDGLKPLLVKGNAFEDSVDSVPTPPTEQAGTSKNENVPLKPWASWRSDAARSGTSNEQPESILKKSWEVRLPGNATPLAIAGDTIYCGTDARQFFFLASDTGKIKHRMITEGEIHIAPFWWQNRIYVGDTEGFTYAMRSDDGRAIWRIQATGTKDHLTAYGHLVSRRPIGCGVVVGNGTAYFTAGFFPHDQVSTHAVNAKTGEVEWETIAPAGKTSAYGTLALDAERLYIPSGWGPPKAIDLTTEEGKTNKHQPVTANKGRSQKGWQLAAIEGSALVASPHLAYTHHVNQYLDQSSALPVADADYVFMADGIHLTSERRAALELIGGKFQPRKKKRRKKNTKAEKKETAPATQAPRLVWEDANKIRRTAIILVGDILFVGSADTVIAVRAKDGKELWSEPVPGEVKDLAFYNGRLYAVCRPGTVVCFEK